MLQDGGSLIVSETPLDSSLTVSGAPSLVICDPSWLPCYGRRDKKDNSDNRKLSVSDEDAHFLKLSPCRHGVWLSYLGPEWLVLLNSKAIDDDAMDYQGLLQADAINKLPWTTKPRQVTVDNGNLFIFSEAAYPNQDSKQWFDDWINRAFQLTSQTPLNVTGDVRGPAGCFWRLQEEEQCVVSIEVLTDTVTNDYSGIRIRVV